MRSLVRFAIIGALWAGPVAFAADPSGISSELDRTTSMSRAEKEAYATNSNTEIGNAEKEVAGKLNKAKGGNAEEVECLLTRLTAIRALQSVSDRAEGAMKEAFTAGNEEKANHEFRKIAVAVSKTRQLLAEARQCSASDENGANSPTIVDWESFLQDYEDVFDPFDLDELDFGQDPPQISPFQ